MRVVISNVAEGGGGGGGGGPGPVGPLPPQPTRAPIAAIVVTRSAHKRLWLVISEARKLSKENGFCQSSGRCARPANARAISARPPGERNERGVDCGTRFFRPAPSPPASAFGLERRLPPG